jgi:FKBP-type peptidyl-prolyl cis-trans isomerase
MRTPLICLLPITAVALTACGDSKPTQPVAPGLIVTDLVVGAGVAAAQGDTLGTSFIGRLTDSTLIASTRGKTFYFRLGVGEVIRGFDLGLPGMRTGGTRRLVIPPELAYGETGSPGVIPPDATLVFDVTLVEVRSATKPAVSPVTHRRPEMGTRIAPPGPP